MGRRWYWPIATLVLILLIAANGYASAQEGTPTATSTAVIELPLAAIPDGTWLVGLEVSAGIYTAPGGERCYWKRLSGFGGTSDEVIASASGAVRPIVEIAPTDKGFETSNCGQWTPVSLPATPAPVSSPTPVSTPVPTASLTATAIPTVTALPALQPTVRIPQGWKRIVDERLGYSLALPLPWVMFDLQGGVLNPIAGIFGGEEALATLHEILEILHASNVGVLAIEPDLSQLFARPPFPMFLNVSMAPTLDDMAGDDLVAYVRKRVGEFRDVQLLNIRTGTVNGLPALQAVASADLSGFLEIDLTPQLIFTVVHANQKAYLLTIAVRSDSVEAKQELIDRIVATFLPEYGAPQVVLTTAPASAPTSRQTSRAIRTPTATLTSIPAETPPPTPTATQPPTPTPTVTPAPTPVVTVPRGWSRVVNERLGYSLAVPRGWLVFDVHSAQLGQILRFIDPAAAEEAGGLLSTPGAENAGHVAVRLDIFSRPPFKVVAGVGIAPLDDGMTTEGVVKQLRDEIETFDMVPLKVTRLEAGTTNNLPSIQGVVTADLSEHGLFNAHAVMTALLANDRAYLLFVAVPASEAEAMQEQIEQIVGSFRPE